METALGRTLRIYGVSGREDKNIETGYQRADTSGLILIQSLNHGTKQG